MASADLPQIAPATVAPPPVEVTPERIAARESVLQEFAAANLPMMLHAETVEIPLQQSKPPIKVSAPLPEAMEKLLRAL